MLLAAVAALLATFAAFALAQYGAAAIGLLRAQAPLERRGRRRGELETLIAGLKHRVSKVWAARVTPLLPKKLEQDVTRQIVQAGGLEGLTPGQLVIYAFGATLAGLALGLLVVVLTGWSPGWVLGAALLGAVLPFMWLRDQVKRRHLEILVDLPYHLDLLTLCVEAGLDFSAGVQKMVEKGKPGALREEFNGFLGELRIGKTRAEALETMSQRVGLPQLSSFLAALVQAERMGTGLAKTLRVQSDQLRVERFQRAETSAGEAPVKMLLPLVLFVFPTIWIVLAAPLVFEWFFAK